MKTTPDEINLIHKTLVLRSQAAIEAREAIRRLETLSNTLEEYIADTEGREPVRHFYTINIDHDVRRKDVR